MIVNKLGFYINIIMQTAASHDRLLMLQGRQGKETARYHDTSKMLIAGGAAPLHAMLEFLRENLLCSDCLISGKCVDQRTPEHMIMLYRMLCCAMLCHARLCYVTRCDTMTGYATTRYDMM